MLLLGVDPGGGVFMYSLSIPQNIPVHVVGMLTMCSNSSQSPDGWKIEAVIRKKTQILCIATH